MYIMSMKQITNKVCVANNNIVYFVVFVRSINLCISYASYYSETERNTTLTAGREMDIYI